MPFLLKRGGANLPLEVQRWQYFLLRQGLNQAGAIDGQFGLMTETATRFFQVQQALPASGELDAATLQAARGLGYTVVPDTHYDDKADAGFPPRPRGLASPGNAARIAGLGCFSFRQLPLENRSDPDEINILSSCDGSVADWRRTNIITIPIAQPVFARGFGGSMTCHRAVAPHVQALFAKWAELDLLHLVRDYDGAFSPRYKRGKSPGPGSQPPRRADQVDDLSNHAFGSAFDIDASDNPFRGQPALCPKRGCVRELVPSANELGFFWGGHFSSPKDGMHFEFADFDAL